MSKVRGGVRVGGVLPPLFPASHCAARQPSCQVTGQSRTDFPQALDYTVVPRRNAAAQAENGKG